MGGGNLATLVLFIVDMYGWCGVEITSAQTTLIGDLPAANHMPPSDGVNGELIFLREEDEKYVYVQRKISSKEYNIDVRMLKIYQFRGRVEMTRTSSFMRSFCRRWHSNINAALN